MITEKLRKSNINLNVEEQAEIIKLFQDNTNNSPLLQARYIRTGLGDKFYPAILEALYRKITTTEEGTSELLRAISHLCIPKRRNVGIKSVVTYNYDDLLEKHLSEQEISYVPIFKETDTCSFEELAVYHVHGYLPRDASFSKEQSNSLLVLSEEVYHALMLDPYSWSNITQLNLLRENTCLMLGLSMTDPNLRRLLEIASRKSPEPKHYAILKRHTTSSRNIKVGKKALDTYINVDQELQEESYKELGVRIIWVDDYKEIPQILREIRGPLK